LRETTNAREKQDIKREKYTEHYLKIIPSSPASPTYAISLPRVRHSVLRQLLTYVKLFRKTCKNWC